jgi:hypothetical protein
MALPYREDAEGDEQHHVDGTKDERHDLLPFADAGSLADATSILPYGRVPGGAPP